ncbi:MAG: hypothetical protein HY367_00015 [Candidatus Aenigmarchaeota archaeon]|nr:hypothetical protein [Candidatus Aenigmarchaeota archaeon]
MDGSRYGELGVDVHKAGIEAFRDAVSGIYRHAFCDIHPDPDMPGYGFVHHTDGTGSKPVQNYLNWKETGDLESFRGIAQDTLAMNIGDAFCVGIPTSGSFVDYVAINRFHAPKKEALQILAEDFTKLFGMLDGYGIRIMFAGGETADLPDQLRTLDVAGAIHARYKLDSVITGEEIRPGDTIIGLASGGQAKYESKPAGAIMSNGLTLARHCLMRHEFGEKYPEIREPGNEYTGPFSPTDVVEGIEGTVGEELTRPTRIFAPAFKGAIEHFGNSIHGIVFNTGGGHTKCLRVGRGIMYVKDSLPDPPAIFKMVQGHGRVPWKEMYEDFNMGVGAELYVDSAASSEVQEFVREEFNIAASRIGKCGKCDGKNKVRLETIHGNF